MSTSRSASVASLAQALPDPLRCPVCSNMLVVDQCWLSPHWLCSSGHSYSNLRVLIAELRERGWLAEPESSPQRVYAGEAVRQPAVQLR